MLKLMAVREVPFGATVHLVRNGQPTSTTYVRRAYDRSSKTYDLDSWDDISKQVFVRGDRQVYWDTGMPLLTFNGLQHGWVY